MPRHLPVFALLSLALATGVAAAGAGCNSSDNAGVTGNLPAPVIDGFDYQPKGPIDAGDSYTLTLNAHGPGGAAIRTEWQASAGVLSADQGPTTVWRAVKPGAQLHPGRARIEVRVVTVGGTASASKGGSVFLTIGPEGNASLDGFMPDVYGDTPGPTPTPGLPSPVAATPVPSPTAVTDDAASDAAASGAATDTGATSQAAPAASGATSPSPAAATR